MKALEKPKAPTCESGWKNPGRNKETTLQRQKEGIQIAKGNGVYKGRKRKEVDGNVFTEQYVLWKAGKTQPKYICQKLGISYSTFKRRVVEYEKEHGIR